MAKNILPDVIGNDALRARLGRGLTCTPPSLSHAYILEGRTGSGRHTLATQIAAALCCAERNNPAVSALPCGVCPACRKILSGLSPDLIRVTPEEDHVSLGIDVIRALRGDVHIYPNELEHKIYIVESADTMTPQAQNAFLLTLEEPPQYVQFFLLCEDAGMMLETIRSRAPVLRMQPLTPEQTEAAVIAAVPEAARRRESDREGFRGLILSAEGCAGQAIRLLSEREAEHVAALREGAQTFCRLAGDRKSAASFLLHLCQDCGSSRSETLEQLKTIRLAVRDLTVLKKRTAAEPADCGLRFFADADAAAELADDYSIRRLLTIGDAVDNAILALGRNMNQRLTLLSLAEQIGMLD